MPIIFSPKYIISPKIAQFLMRIEAVKAAAAHLPVTPEVLASLRETARLTTTHYSTMIEGNRLSIDQIKEVLEFKGHFPGKERDEKEVKGYYAALSYAEKASLKPLTEKIIQTIHALVIAGGKKSTTPTPYRDGQNSIRDGRTGALVYLPPESHDVPGLMKAMVNWINTSTFLPFPIVAAIAHYQFATIHPYYDGNGRTARLLTTLLLHKKGYDLKGIYSLEEYYARNLNGYYKAISVGESHNYYLGRAEADITEWIEYFTEGMAQAFENVLEHMATAETKGSSDQSHILRTLDPRQRKTLALFEQSKTITTQQICTLFEFRPRTGSQLCKKWIQEGFLEIVNPSNKARSYKLAEKYESLIGHI